MPPDLPDRLRNRLILGALACALLLPGCTRPGPGGPGVAGSADAAAASELKRAAERADMCSNREALAAGLRADYYARPGFAGATIVSRQEGPLDQPWPAAGAAPEPRSARWRGWVKPVLAGRYSFHAADPGIRITVGGQAFGAGAPAGSSIELATGRYYPVTVEWPDRPTGSPLSDPRLSWTAPHGARFLVPRAALFPPSDTVADAGTPAR